MAYVTIQSFHFTNSFLRLDGSETKSFEPNGSGVADCQNYAGPWETLKLVAVPEAGENVFAIGSTTFDDVWLRMDATKNPGGKPGSGFGTVNLQFTHRKWELFTFLTQEDGTTAIQSHAFPGAYLRMDAEGDNTGNGFGTVNCQTYIGPWEKFIVLPVDFKTKA